MSEKNRFIKKAGIIVGIIIIFGILIYAATELILKPYLKDKIRNNVQTFNNVRYSVDFKDIDFQFFSGNIYVNRLEIIPEKDPLNITRDNYKLIVEKLSLIGFNFWKLLKQDNYQVDKIKIADCEILVYKYVHTDSISSNTTAADTIDRGLAAINIGTFEVSNGNLIIYNTNKSKLNPLFRTRVNLTVDDIYYQYGKVKDLEYSNLSSAFSDVVVKTPDSLRLFNVKSIKITGNNNLHQAEAEAFSMKTRTGKYQLAEMLGHEGDWINLIIPSIKTHQWQVKPMLLDLSFNASSINIHKPEVTVFTDKRYPANKSKKFQLPYDFISELKTTFTIDTITISSAFVKYEEHVKAMEKPGHITFNNLNAAIRNFTNDSSSLKNNGRRAYMHVNAAVMNAAPLQADFTFELRPHGTNTVKGSLGKMDLTAVNPMISQVGYIKIEKGVCHSMDFNFTYDNQKAQGEVIFIYDNLEVETISQNDGDEDSFGQEIKSVVADFIIDDENEADNPNVGKISYSRNVNKSTINYWWKSLLTGLKTSIGLPGEIKENQ